MIGLLWFDDDPNRDLEQKVGNAAKRYMEKFGRRPDVCYVHPSMVGAESIIVRVDGFQLRVKGRRSVLRDHLLVAQQEESFLVSP